VGTAKDIMGTTPDGEFREWIPGIIANSPIQPIANLGTGFMYVTSL